MIRRNARYLVLAAMIAFAANGNAGTSAVSPALAACSDERSQRVAQPVGDDDVERLVATGEVLETSGVTRGLGGFRPSRLDRLGHPDGMTACSQSGGQTAGDRGLADAGVRS